MLCFSIFVAIITIRTTAQDDANCSRLFECGQFKIGYPFWGLSRPAYCGLPAFRLRCGIGETPMIGISGIPHKILRIDEFSRTLTLLREGFGGIPCLPTRTITLASDLFDYAPDTQFVVLFYDCPPPDVGIQLPASIGRLNCNGGSWDYFLLSEHLLGGFDDSVRIWLESCRNRVRMPANRTELGRSSPPPTSVERLAAAMNRGFGLRWTRDYDGACVNCTKSGGVCGFSERAARFFACYCAGQAYAADCLALSSASPPEKQLGTIFLFFSLSSRAR
ncbi:unnamed protein product [Linum tenue]|uniref:non-specific serine/threonine protein kinase n=1 Tax=Linum tenue TaxID=586396 RepID=A0AAV0HV38_9ROSI|nr:unnamed protein product [Linum tenue]